jgi:hypothetical protein
VAQLMNFGRFCSVGATDRKIDRSPGALAVPAGYSCYLDFPAPEFDATLLLSLHSELQPVLRNSLTSFKMERLDELEVER